MEKKIVAGIIIAILAISLIGFLFVYTSQYIAEYFAARAIPLSIIIGFCVLGISILFSEHSSTK